MQSGQPRSFESCKKLQFTDVVGTFGKWQVVVCLHGWIALIFNVMHNMIITFHAPNVDYHCAMPEEIKECNVTDLEWISHGIPYEDGGLLSKCTMYESWNMTYLNRSIVSCHQWNYDRSVHANTIIGTFDLVCDRRWMISLLKSSYMFGYMACGIICGISDRLGRRPVILVSLGVFLTAAILSVFSTSVIMLTVLRFLISLGITTCTTVTFTLQTEIVGAKERVDVSYFRSALWTLGMLFLVGISYFVRNWISLQLIVTIPAVFLLASAWWFVYESPRFLLTYGQEAQSMALLKLAARWNNKSIDNEDTVLRELVDGILKDDKAKSHASYFDLFRTPELRKRTLLLYCVWFVSILVYYGISYNTNRLHGDMYVNFTISAFVEIPGQLVCFIISRYFGRRRSLVFSMVLCGISLVVFYIVPGEHPWVMTALVMTAKALIKGSVTDVYIYTAEIMPTVVRNIGLGSCSTFSRLGGIAAPFATETMGNRNTHLMFGMLSIATGLSVLLLPETHNMNIWDTIKEARNFDRKDESTKV